MEGGKNLKWLIFFFFWGGGGVLMGRGVGKHEVNIDMVKSQAAILVLKSATVLHFI